MSTSERISEVRPLETRGPKGIKGFSIAAIAAIAVLLSMAFPYGIGLLLIVWTAAIIGAVVGTGIVCFKLAKEVLSGSLSFNYSHTYSLTSVGLGVSTTQCLSTTALPLCYL